MYLKPISEIVDDLRIIMRDTSNERWSLSEIYMAIDRSIQEWAGRVMFPATYTFGYIDTEVELDIPYYIQGDLQPQHRDYTNYNSDGTVDSVTGKEVWKDIPMFEVLKDEDGTRTLVLPGSARGTSIRCVYWCENGPVPQITADVPSGDWAADDTSLNVDFIMVKTLPTVGYIKVDDEYISYEGVTYGSSSVTLTNCGRGTFGTTAATHTADTAVDWCIAVTDQSLFSQLEDQAVAKLHAYYLTNASPKEIETHTWLMRWYEQRVSDYWKRYVSPKSTRSYLTMRGRIR